MSASSQMDVSQQLNNIAQARQRMEAMFLSTVTQAENTLKSRAADLARAAELAGASPEMKLRAARYKALVAALADVATAIIKLPPQSADSFILHGQILDSTGAPLAEVSVSLSDTKGILNARVPAVKTDAAGYYTITLRAAEFPELTPGTSEIFVSVTGANGQEIAKPAQPVIFQPGKVAVMPIVAA